MCRDHKCLTTCQKHHRQNEPAGWVDVPSRVQVHVTGSQTHVGISDVPIPVKNNTDRMNQLVG